MRSDIANLAPCGAHHPQEAARLATTRDAASAVGQGAQMQRGNPGLALTCGKPSTPASSTARSAKAADDAKFDAFVRCFAPEVFVNAATGTVFVEASHYQGAGKPLRLDENCFIGSVNEGRVHQRRSVGYAGQEGSYDARFEGGMRIHRKRGTITVQDADGTRSKLTKVFGRAAREILDKVQFEPLPSSPGFLAPLPDGRCVLVDHNWEGCRAFMVEPGRTSRIKARVTQSFFKGANFVVETPVGSLTVQAMPPNQAGLWFTPKGGGRVEALGCGMERDKHAAAVIMAKLGFEASLPR